MEENIFIASNTSMLDIVWNNILSNAIRFSNLNGKISTDQTSDQKEIYVQITDTGIGCGMSLVLRVVNLLKGSITIENTLGMGTKMMVELKRG